MRKIILLRHGEVDILEQKSISANAFGKWIIEYNNSDIKSEISNKDEIKNLFNSTDLLICSNLKRSINSLELFDKTAFEISNIYNEAELPYANWNLLKLSANAWLIFFRIAWLFGYSQNCESYKVAKRRANYATKKLIKLSNNKKAVILVGHGVMNKLIQKELIMLKWNETKKSKNNNWDYQIFEIEK